MAISLAPFERESVFQIDDETLEYDIYTCQGRMITKLTNAGHTPYWCEKDGDRIVAGRYKLPYNGISIRSYKAIHNKREISEERKEQLRENLTKARQNSKK